MQTQRHLHASELNAMIGASNRERIREFFIDHVGATRRECAEYLDLSTTCVTGHVKAIRREWDRSDA